MPASRLAVLAALTSLTACTGQESGSIDTADEASLVTMVRAQALKIGENSSGALEADIGSGHSLIYVPEGEFTMGSSDNGSESFSRPAHKIALDGYWLGKYPVTVSQFAAFVADTGHVTDAEKGEGCWVEHDQGGLQYGASWQDPKFKQGDNHPAICISWNDAAAYTGWLAAKTGLPFTLPTEAQWEKAARGNDERVYPWGNEAPDGTQANFADVQYIHTFSSEGRNADKTIDDGYAQTSPVDAYPKGVSPYGIYDMAGNTIDWVYDWFDTDAYNGEPRKNPTGPTLSATRLKYDFPGGWSSNLLRSIRGGAWTDASGQQSTEEGGHSIRSDRRESTEHYSSDDHLGFRVALDGQRPAISEDPTINITSNEGLRASVSEVIGGVTVQFNYAREALAGRDNNYFGVVAEYEKPWSIAGPAPTFFSTDDTLYVNGEPLPAGMYVLEIIPLPFSEKPAEGASQWMPPRSVTEWRLVFREWNGRQGSGDVVLNTGTRAQIEDNTKEDLEVFFDWRDERGTIARILFEYVEVHINLSSNKTDIEPLVEVPASIMNSIGQRGIHLSYQRLLQEGDIFGETVPFDTLWNPGTQLELQGALKIGDKEVAAGRYRVEYIPKESGPWEMRLTPENGAGESVSISVNAEKGEDSLSRMEYYFDSYGEGVKAVIMVWGNYFLQFPIAAF